MCHALEAYNYEQRNNKIIFQLILVKCTVSVEIGHILQKMHKNNGIDGKIHLGPKFDEMDEEQQFEYRSMHYYKYLYSNQIVMIFENE